MSPTNDRFGLERAKSYVYEGRLQEAYTLFRRFYDRLPFQPQAEHGEHIGMFVRVLLELGKGHELAFYRNEAERIYSRTREPALGYQLAYLYTYAGDHYARLAIEIFQSLVERPEAAAFHVKAKVMLIFHHNIAGRIAECRSLLDTIEDPGDDPRLCRVVWIWRANIARNEGKLEEAEAHLKVIYDSCSLESDWYGFLSAKIEEARVAFAKGEEARRNRLVRELRKHTRNRRYHSIKVQIDQMEKWFREEDDLGTLHLRSLDDRHTVSYGGRELELEPSTIVDRLLMVLLKRRSIDKAGIVQRVYSREYEPRRDDKRIHYQIYSLRKRLEAIGVPPEAIECRENGYRVVVAVELTGEVS